MIRNLKALGLALVAMLALGAVVASGASAQNGEAVSEGEAPFTLTGEETPESALLANSFGGIVSSSVTCDESTYAGHKYNETPHEFIESGASTVTITPEYNQPNCRAHIPILGTRPATVTTNGCDYVFHIGETTEGENTYGVTADVVCPEGKTIDVEIFKVGSEHKPENVICTITVGPQTGLSGPHLTQTTTGAEHVDLTGTFSNIHAEYKGSLCGHSAYTTTTTAFLNVDVTIKAHDEDEEPIKVTIVD